MNKWTFFLILSLFPFYSHSSDSFILPIGARFEGVGGFYGVAGGLRNVGEDKSTVLLGATFGDVEAFGAVNTGRKLGNNWKYSFGAGFLNNADIETSYQRGFSAGSSYSQNIKAFGGFAAFETMLSERTSWKIQTALSSVQLNGFKNSSGQAINLPGAKLLDVTSVLISLPLKYYLTDSLMRPQKGFVFSIQPSFLVGRPGQSDLVTMNYGVKSYLPIIRSFNWVNNLRYSHSGVLRKSEYDSESAVRNELGIDCSSLTGSELSDCNQLESDLVSFISAGNQRGLASPLGGAAGLRSFREQRFKASHTALLSTELRWHLTEFLKLGAVDGKKNRIEIVPFYDLGYASDFTSQLFNESRSSYGAGLRFITEGATIKVESANGDEGSAWFIAMELGS